MADKNNKNFEIPRPVFPKRAVITGGMPYGNKELHFGHVGGMFVFADTFARFMRRTASLTEHLNSSSRETTISSRLHLMLTEFPRTFLQLRDSAEARRSTPKSQTGSSARSTKRDSSSR